MALNKVTYKNGETIITAENLNAIQDEIRANLRNVSYNSTSGKLQKTTNTGTVTDILTVDTEPTDGSMNPITSDAAYELKGALNGLDLFIRNKKIAIFGDSLSDENITWSTTVNDVWVKTFRTITAPYNATITNYSLSSRGYVAKAGGKNIVEVVAETDLSSFDTIIIFAEVLQKNEFKYRYDK